VDDFLAVTLSREAPEPLDRGERTIALWGARRPEQLEPISGVLGWRIDEDTMREIDRILEEEIPKPVGPEFMAPSQRAAA